ncbi:hypothetical protein [Lyngbya confervoides]|uniref:Lipopolysaccharide assembly protein A domain-containing protein n=1 Tax=Lyngbya confervoides BDU141951 TaxID=1574623 RepID=A0ABD4SZW7_9CYAN|nr:hypothetical protein [Lyngbya confervoides]MCM1981903.1 hypothetical protein [Lyngbya confervoides BDU141951]
MRIPIVLATLVALTALILQNRTPVLQLTFLGLQSRPFSLGLWAAAALGVGVGLGLFLQLLFLPASRASGQNERSPRSDRFSRRRRPAAAQSSGTQAGGWNTGGTSSWSEQAEQQEAEDRFWSAPEKSVSPNPRRSRESAADLDRPSAEAVPSPPSPDQTIVDAEYRVVSTPYSRPNQDSDENWDEFDDDFFDEVVRDK